jgi:hypothetical protein
LSAIEYFIGLTAQQCGFTSTVALMAQPTYLLIATKALLHALLLSIACIERCH